MLRVKYCKDCGEDRKRKWPVASRTRPGRCSICGKAKECFSVESTKLNTITMQTSEEPLPPKTTPSSNDKDSSKKRVIRKIKGPLQVDDTVVSEVRPVSKTEKGLPKGRKPAKLTAEAARKMRDKVLSNSLEITIDFILEKVNDNIINSTVVVYLKDIPNSLGLEVKTIEKAIKTLGYEVDVSVEGQIRIKW